MLGKEKVGHLGGGKPRGFHEIGIGRRCQQEGCYQGREHKNGKQGREDTFDPPAVKIDKGKTALMVFAQKNAGDEIAGDDKKDVNAQIAAGQRLGEEMKHEDRQDGDCPDAVYACAVRCGCC